MVGRRMFAAEIHARSETAQLDWRADYAHHEYRATEVPAETAAGVLRLLDWFGLSFGALDFVVTPAGDWVFLEVNPNGQWGWIETETGLPITAASCDYLEGT